MYPSRSPFTDGVIWLDMWCCYKTRCICCQLLPALPLEHWVGRAAGSAGVGSGGFHAPCPAPSTGTFPLLFCFWKVSTSGVGEQDSSVPVALLEENAIPFSVSLELQSEADGWLGWWCGSCRGPALSSCSPGGSTQGPWHENVLLAACFQQEKCCSDVGGRRVGGSPWLLRKYCFYVISFHTPATCGK